MSPGRTKVGAVRTAMSLGIALLYGAVALPAVAGTDPGEYQGAWLHQERPVDQVLKAPIDAEGAARLKEAAAIRGFLPKADEDVARGLRIESMKQEARKYGLNSGLYWRQGKIEKLLDSVSPEVDQIFHFGPVMLEGVMLPPVITQFDEAFRLENPSLARATTKAYRIEHEARIVATAPTWRDFLVRSYPEPKPPAEAIWPQDDEEGEIWEREIRTGWSEGVDKADAMFEASLALLTRTYKGMITYHELVRAGVVSKPILKKTPAGVAIEGRSLDIGSVIYRLEDQSEFQSPRNWRAMRQEQAKVGEE